VKERYPDLGTENYPYFAIRGSGCAVQNCSLGWHAAHRADLAVAQAILESGIEFVEGDATVGPAAIEKAGPSSTRAGVEGRTMQRAARLNVREMPSQMVDIGQRRASRSACTQLDAGRSKPSASSKINAASLSEEDKPERRTSHQTTNSVSFRD
jgi:hypothetical protein